jgi:hypothetical protein
MQLWFLDGNIDCVCTQKTPLILQPSPPGISLSGQGALGLLFLYAFLSAFFGAFCNLGNLLRVYSRMIRKSLCALLGVFMISAFHAEAQPARRGPGGGPNFMTDFPVAIALDTNRDQVISAEEMEAAADSLKKADANGDGKIGRDELMPSLGGRGGGKGRGGPRGPRGPRGPGGRGPGGPGDGGTPGMERIPPGQLPFKDGVGSIPDLATYEKLSYQGPEVMVDTHLADWKFVKFQIEDVGLGKPVIYFINTKTHRGHPMFMRQIGIDRGDGSMRGVLVYRPLKKAPNGEPGMFTFEYEPNDAYPFDRIQLSHEMLVEHMPYLRGRLGYYPMPSRALPLYRREKEQYDTAAFPVVLDEDLQSDLGFLPLNAEASYGRLSLMQAGELPSPRDIVIYRTLPNEMPRVAGVITAERQTPLSHVNLRAIQDSIPNAFITEATTQKDITGLLGKLVYYEVNRNGYELRAADAAEVDSYFASIRPTTTQSPRRDLSVKTARPLHAIGFEDGAIFGVKTSNLATLHTLDFPEGTIPDGFGVPFHFYDVFMQHNGFYDVARELIAGDAFMSDRDVRVDQLEAFRKSIQTGGMPGWMMVALGEIQASFPEGQGIRCRSSTNNEDLPGFSGAGLYDSYTHQTDEGHLAETIKQVFASLWNFRAFEERAFYRIDHFTTAMGVLVHPNFKDESANGVAVTDDILYQTKGNYYLNTQVGEDLVTHPDGTSIPEELLLDWWRPQDTKIMRRSSLAQGNALLLSEGHLGLMHACLGKIHSRFARLYGKSINDPAFAMEIEYKVTREGTLAIKQARPWVY